VESAKQNANDSEAPLIVDPRKRNETADERRYTLIIKEL
jgi:hypothetical protein